MARYFHCSAVDHPDGFELTGPATRDALSRWTEEEPTYDPDRVYIFALLTGWTA